jgi:hypothetical protein
VRSSTGRDRELMPDVYLIDLPEGYQVTARGQA